MKKILILDDQLLVVMSLEKLLKDLSFEVITANNVIDTISKFDLMQPDLVILDVNMSVNLDNQNSSGLQVLNHIRKIKKSEIPVILLSGNTDQEVIEEGFRLGATDYLKKPLSLNEIGIRVKKILGSDINSSKETKSQFIQNKVIGVVIPCYNEEKRLLSDDFKSFVNTNLGYHLCFVNDGSKDNTLQVLNELKKGNEGRISVYNCKKNGGKAEAVRQGMLHLSKENQFDFIGFLDADLSTNFDDFELLAETIKNSNYKIVSGSRITRMGADIAKESARAIISKTINFIIRKTLEMDFRDTQCGAKIMTKDVVNQTFKNKFLTKWLFDVEIFMRMKKIYGLKTAKTFLYEKPLDRWVHMDGSKLSFKDSFKILGQIIQIAWHYR